MTIDAVTGTVITPPLAVLDPDGVYTITYTAGGITLQWQALISGGC
jgi:hypothetical protein